MPEEAIYLGDGAYAIKGNGDIGLSLGDHRATPIIYLEPAMVDKLKEFTDSHFKKE